MQPLPFCGSNCCQDTRMACKPWSLPLQVSGSAPATQVCTSNRLTTTGANSPAYLQGFQHSGVTHMSRSIASQAPSLWPPCCCRCCCRCCCCRHCCNPSCRPFLHCCQRRSPCQLCIKSSKKRTPWSDEHVSAVLSHTQGQPV